MQLHGGPFGMARVQFEKKADAQLELKRSHRLVTQNTTGVVLYNYILYVLYCIPN